MFICVDGGGGGVKQLVIFCKRYKWVNLYKAYCYFYYKRENFVNKNNELYNTTTNKIFAKINGMPHQFFVVGIQVRDIYPELK